MTPSSESSDSSRTGASIWDFPNPLLHPIIFLYFLYQTSPPSSSPLAPSPSTHLTRPRIAVIGAGITGVTSAAHCIGHGFDVMLFETGTDADSALGGIWSRVNRMGRGVCAIGTCGEAKVPGIEGMDRFKGEVHHSSKLTGRCEVKAKTMVVIGGGASAVEALEYANEQGANKVYVLARSEKWIIPRNPVWNMLLALNIFGQETFLSRIPELFLRKMFYRDLEDLAPAGKGLFTDTPMVNSDIMEKLRSNKAEWIRCDIEKFTEDGVQINRREKGVPSGGPGKQEVIKGDVVVMATGFARPKLDFLPKTCFDKPYDPPNWYLQTFPPNHPSISCINCTYMNAIGTVGNWHIGIYTRILLMFLVDPLTRPSPFWMRRWIDMTRFLKMASPVGPFEFFTYLELIWWFTFCVAFNPFRWKWALFVFFGLGFVLPARVVEAEDRVRSGLGVREDEASGEDVGFSI
ncbi:hypothetical protein N0V88_005161 [Collariella sp. IMI 366227]|nr:hypothetical protein N0V88_005161 [Collariella sp. IMI 366227]